jgi:hypothetical protein
MAKISENKERIVVEDLLALADYGSDDFEHILNGDYAEVVKALGIDIAVKMYIHFRGCHLSFPKYFYMPDYVVRIASNCQDKREREKIAITCGYTSQWVERKVRANVH